MNKDIASIELDFIGTVEKVALNISNTLSLLVGLSPWIKKENVNRNDGPQYFFRNLLQVDLHTMVVVADQMQEFLDPEREGENNLEWHIGVEFGTGSEFYQNRKITVGKGINIKIEDQTLRLSLKPSISAGGCAAKLILEFPEGRVTREFIDAILWQSLIDVGIRNGFQSYTGSTCATWGPTAPYCAVEVHEVKCYLERE